MIRKYTSSSAFLVWIFLDSYPMLMMVASWTLMVLTCFFTSDFNEEISASLWISTDSASWVLAVEWRKNLISTRRWKPESTKMRTDYH